MTKILALNQRAVDGLLSKIDALERENADLKRQLDVANQLEMADYDDDLHDESCDCQICLMETDDEVSQRIAANDGVQFAFGPLDGLL